MLSLLPSSSRLIAGDWRMEHAEVKSGNARNVILSYNEKIYYVNHVKVQIQEGAETMKAIFHAKQAGGTMSQDLDIEINKATYDILMEYAKLDKEDLVMILQINGADSKWFILSEAWLKNNPSSKTGSSSYIV